MNSEKVKKFDVNYFNKLNKEEKEKYFINFIRETLDIMDKKEDTHVNRL